jgi:uncharacterized protein (TIGR02611 family)
MKRLVHHTKRVLRITAGVVVLIAGVVMSVPGVPGPGLLVVFAGLSILAIDFVWAHRLKMKLKEQTKKVVDKVRGRVDGSEKS